MNSTNSSGILDGIKARTPEVDVMTILRNTGGSFIEHPFIWLGGAFVLLLIFVVFFKAANDSAETWMQRKTHRFAWAVVIILFWLALLFAMDAGLLTTQVMLGLFS
jgi:hypothetical protein